MKLESKLLTLVRALIDGILYSRQADRNSKATKLGIMVAEKMDDVLQQLEQVIRMREGENPAESYVANLLHKGGDHILKKLGEEAAETIIAGKNEDVEELIKETADLWFHSLLLLRYRGVGPEDVLNELASRFGRSGIEEKKHRKK